jgi:hypothetical protein
MEPFMERWFGKQRRLRSRDHSNQNALALRKIDRFDRLNYVIWSDHGFYSSRHARMIHRTRSSLETTARSALLPFR